LGLVILEGLLEVAVSREVDSLVGSLSQRRQGNTTIQSAKALLFYDSVERMGGVAVLGDVEGIGHAVVLSLQSDLDDFHRRHNGNGFGNTGGETS